MFKQRGVTIFDLLVIFLIVVMWVIMAYPSVNDFLNKETESVINNP